MQPEELSEGKLIDLSGCDGKDEVIPEEVTLGKNFMLRTLLEVILQH